MDVVHCTLGQRHITVFEDHFLTLLGQHHLDELTLQRSQLAIRRLVHVNVEETRQRVSTGDGVFFVSFDERLAFFCCQRG